MVSNLSIPRTICRLGELCERSYPGQINRGHSTSTYMSDMSDGVYLLFNWCSGWLIKETFSCSHPHQVPRDSIIVVDLTHRETVTEQLYDFPCSSTERTSEMLKDVGDRGFEYFD